jgi:glycosyltransferase involved in cell wall biosynthesis
VKKVMNFDIHSINRVRRLSRAYYKSFDELFVLNTDHKKWLSGKDMEISENKIHLTAHWVDEVFSPQLPEKERLFSVDSDTKIILFVGRLSFEKGIKDIAALAKEIPKSMKHRFVFVGEGPASTYILKHLPNALLLGWQDKPTLAQLYSSADVLLLPSKFDTFSCVVLEALSCSLPVVSYIEQGVSGYLANGINDLTRYLIDYLECSEALQIQMKQHALDRSKIYTKERILEEFLLQTGLTTH